MGNHSKFSLQAFFYWNYIRSVPVTFGYITLSLCTNTDMLTLRTPLSVTIPILCNTRILGSAQCTPRPPLHLSHAQDICALHTSKASSQEVADNTKGLD